MSDRPETPILDRVDTPADLKTLSDDELHRLTDELRAETISAVSVTGGHLGAGLGEPLDVDALHRADGSDRHERRRLDRAVRRVQSPASRPRRRRRILKRFVPGSGHKERAQASRRRKPSE